MATSLKKKRLDAQVIHKIRSIATTNIEKPVAKEPKLFISESLSAQIANKEIVVEETLATKVQEPTPKYIPKSNGIKRNLLEALREKISSDYNIEEVKDAEALSDKRLREVWNNYTAKLETQPNKHSTIQTFRIAKLQTETDNLFTITVHSVTHQKFIEQEKSLLCDFIQHAFNNRSINFKILIEAGEKEDIPLCILL